MPALIRSAVLILLLLAPSACSKFQKYNGPEVTSIVVLKAARQLYLLHGSETLKHYNVDLGFAPTGDKKIKNDGKTPEGTYAINRRNPNSAFHLSLGISYPNAKDISEARAMGKSPGGDIFIHGGPRLFRDRSKPDWTAGCISVSNREIEEIYAMVKPGTKIDIRP